VTSPEQAVARATQAAAEARAAGAYREPPHQFVVEVPSIWDHRLYDWALISPDDAQVYSTRRWGAPITWVKRGLLRALRQYHGQITAQQSRFNTHVAAHLMSLDERLQVLERMAGRWRAEQGVPPSAERPASGPEPPAGLPDRPPDPPSPR
jgi:hypothetical protein